MSEEQAKPTEYPIRLRLKVDLPNGMTAGRIVQARRCHPDLRMRGDPWWFARVAEGEEIGLFFRDAEGVDEL